MPFARSALGSAHASRCDTVRHIKDWTANESDVDSTVRQVRYCGSKSSSRRPSCTPGMRCRGS
jgi:hypothetical protein